MKPLSQLKPRWQGWSRRQKWLVVALLVLALFTLFRVVQAVTASKRAQVKSDGTVQLKATELVNITSMTFERDLPLSGALNPFEQTTISARAGGEVKNVLVREGETVQKGQTLAELVATNYQAQADQARANVESAKRNWELARTDYANNQALFEQGFIAKMALQRVAVAEQSAHSQYVNAQNAAVIAQRGLADTRITAPIAGVVAMRKVNSGDTVGVGSPLFSVVNDSAFELAAPIAAEQISMLRVGQSVQLNAAGVAAPFTGIVERVNPAALAGSRSYTAYIRVANTGALRSGMFAQGRVILSAREQVISVPASALHSKENRSQVYVVKDNAIEEREVQLGERASQALDAAVEVTSGLAVGEQVLRLDLGNLKNGAPVVLVNDMGLVIEGDTPAAKQAQANASWWARLRQTVAGWFTSSKP